MGDCGCGGGVCTCYAPALYGAVDRPVPWAQTLGQPGLGAAYKAVAPPPPAPTAPAALVIPAGASFVPIRVPYGATSPTGASAPSSSSGSSMMLYVLGALAAIAAVGGAVYYAYRSHYKPRLGARGTASSRSAPARRRRRA